MKVALAHDHLFQIGGAEHILREFSSIYPSAPIHTLIHDTRTKLDFNQSPIITSYLQKVPGSVRFFKYLLPLMPAAWERFNFSGYDVVLSSSSAFVKGIITSPQTVHISYCHSPTRYLWSDSLSYIDELRLPRVAKLYLHSLLSRLRLWDQAAANRVDYFIANSTYIAERIKKYYHRGSVVIYPPVEINKFQISAETEKFFLVVSRLRPYKRVDLVIKAFNALKLPLIIIGGGEEIERLKKMAKSNIIFLGEVDDKTRNYYLARCQALIHPQEEDFGITVIEAMASGRPVLAFGRGGALETVLDNKSGIFFYEQSWEALADTVIRFRSNNFDPTFIRSTVERFDSSRFHQEIRAFVEQATQKTYETIDR